MKLRCIRALVALAIAFGAVAVPSGAAPVHAAATTCSGWTSSVTPPPTIRVYMHKTKTTAVIGFRNYVETVMASEWGTQTTAAAMRAGAITVKQYAWYYVIYWRGGKDAKGNCYDVADTTTDQLYDPSRTPSPQQLAAVAVTWWVSLRKGDALFATGYRAGTGRCLSEIDGWRFYQSDAVDCVRTFHDTTESLVRRFYSNLGVTLPGANDVTGDHRGDSILAVTNPGSGALTVRVLTADRAWSAATAGPAPLPVAPTQAATVIGQASGDVNGDGRTDLVRLASVGATFKLSVLLAGDKTIGPPVTWWSSVGSKDIRPVPPEGGALRLVIGDFNADGLADVGLVRLSPTDAQLWVAISTGTGFKQTVRRFILAEPLLGARFSAGDFTGDGRADLAIQTEVTPNGGKTALVTRVAASSWTQYFPAPAVWGVAEPARLAGTVTLVADVDRNGKDDLVNVWRAGTGSRFQFYRSNGAGFTRSWATGQLPGVPFATTRFVSTDWTGDGRGDLLAFRDLGVSTKGIALGTGVTLYRSDGALLKPVPLPSEPSLIWGTFTAN